MKQLALLIWSSYAEVNEKMEEEEEEVRPRKRKAKLYLDNVTPLWGPMPTKFCSLTADVKA